jgi:surface polysaccharide O-acyltransferase-like enzyme
MTHSISQQQRPQTHQHLQPAQKLQHNRIISIELFRILAIIAVIAMHTVPFSASAVPDSDRPLPVLIDLSCRFSVPFFFIASGYFLGEKIRAGKAVMPTFWRSAKRLTSLYVVWSFFYFLVPIKYLHELRLDNWFSLILKNVQHQGFSILIAGSSYVLWFLPALILGLGAVAVCLACGWQKQLPYVAVALYGIGLLGGSYSLLWTGNDEMDFILGTRNGPFFSTIYVTFGWLISTQKGRLVSASWALALALGGLLLQVLEAKALSAAVSVHFRSFDYLIGTTAFGVGVFFVGVSEASLGKPLANFILEPLYTRRFSHSSAGYWHS